MPVALITGITGQDGSYLAELLLAKGYSVHGIMRRSSSFSTQRIEHLRLDLQHQQAPAAPGVLHLHYGDLADSLGLQRIMAEVAPDEIYNLGGQSHVRLSFDLAEYTTDVVYGGTLRMLEAMRQVCPKARFYQASSSEMFGNAAMGPAGYHEGSDTEPQSPYGIAKLAAYHLARQYRTAYRLHVCNGILFNHTSERRGETFVSRKITRAIGRIVAGLQSELTLGNLDAVRDWGYAPEYMDAAWRMLQQQHPDDYVIGTGESYAVSWFLIEAFRRAGIPTADIDRYLRIDRRYLRPAEVHRLRADSGKALRSLDWYPRTRAADLVGRMVAHDIELAEREKAAGARVLA